LIREIAARAPGSAAHVRFFRDGREQQVTVRLAERPQQSADNGGLRPATPARHQGGSESLLGLRLREIDRHTSVRLDLPKDTHGVLITHVEPLSSAADGGIERGSVLLDINRQHVESIADFNRIARASKPGDILTLYVFLPDLGQHQLKTIRVEDR
jgi:serine protease Do